MQSLSSPKLVTEFIQPVSLLNFIERVKSQRVCLENCMLPTIGHPDLTCLVRVLNVAFEKAVAVRFTTNQWLSCHEVTATYLQNSNDGWSDKFSCTFRPDSLYPGQRILFAIKYTAGGEEFWDNNMGLNYSLLYQV